MTSYHPKDIEYRYCGNCHQFHDLLDGTVLGDDFVLEVRRITPGLRIQGLGTREIAGRALRNLRRSSVR